MIPFWLTPASFGLKGLAYDLAKFDYDNPKPSYENKLKKLDIRLEYEDITKEDYESRKLKLDHDHGKITQLEFDKQAATAKKEPWFTVLEASVHPEDPRKGYFRLDWNEQFVKMLKTHGYAYPNDEMIVNAWFKELCSSVAWDSGEMEKMMNDESEFDKAAE